MRFSLTNSYQEHRLDAGDHQELFLGLMDARAGIVSRTHAAIPLNLYVDVGRQVWACIAVGLPVDLTAFGDLADANARQWFADAGQRAGEPVAEIDGLLVAPPF